MKCPVIYDDKSKIWSYPFEDAEQKMSLGQIIFNKLNTNDPNKIIECNYDNGEKLTSDQLKTLVISIAQNLLNLGLKKGDIVLLFNEMNSLTTPIIYACYTIGAAICPMELSLDDDDTVGVVGIVNPTMILYDEVFESRVKSTIEKIKLTNLKYVLSFQSRSDGESVTQMLCSYDKTINDFQVPNLGDPNKVTAAILLTSGSTGLPKAVRLSHSMLRLGAMKWWPTDSNSMIYMSSPLRWQSQVSAMLIPVMTGACRVFSGQTPIPQRCSDLIKKYGVTNIFAVVGLITNIYRNAENEQHRDDLKTLRYVITGGERVATVINELVKNLTPECIFTKCYGMTELAGPIATTETISSDFDSGCGYLTPGLSLKIIDENKNPLGPNQNGQIWLKRIVPHLKYHNNEKANTESYTSDDEWFLTGDYGRVDDENFLYIFNRYKDLIRYKQSIVIPSILEKHLDDHQDVEVSYVVGIPDNSCGEIPVAFIKLNSNRINDTKSVDILKNDIKSFLKLILSSDEILPEKIYFLENIPYTSCGKVDKLKLKALAIEKSTK